jgi:HAD superfamily phosphoserine phosphatase-like hydrolase
MKQIIAAFDFDGTITTKDTLWEFLKHTHSRLQIAGNLILIFPYLLFYKVGLINNGLVKQKLFSIFYRNWTLEKFNCYCESFKSLIDNCIKPTVYQKLKNHLADGHQVVIVSASIENWIKPWAEKEGVDIVLATKIETGKNGLLTGLQKTAHTHPQKR